MRKHCIPVFTCILLLLMSTSTMARIYVSASVSEGEVEVGESVTLTVEIQGEINVPAPTVQVPGCRVQYYGPSTQVSIVNGQRTDSVSHIYSVVPSQAGLVTIPPIEAEVNRKTYRTEPVEFMAVEAGEKKLSAVDQQLQDRIFLDVEVGREQVYPNEEIPLTVNLYFPGEMRLENINYPEIKSDHFLIQPFPRPEQTLEYKNGMTYRVIKFQTTIKALKAGTLDLGTIRLAADALIPQQGMRSFFASGYEYHPLTLHALRKTIVIKEFPAGGRPKDFNGAVGSFRMDVTVEPEELKSGEPVTVRTRIVGEGSFNTVTAPVITVSPDWKYYDPQEVTAKPVQGQPAPREKVFEQIIIPGAQANAIPAIRFSYFDPEEEKYHTITHGPTPIHVSGSGTPQQQVADYRKGAEEKNDVLGEDIVYIKNQPGRLGGLKDNPLLAPGFVGYNLALLGVLGGTVFWRWRKNQEDPADRKQREAIVRTQKILIEAEGLIRERKPSEFYDRIYQGVQSYLKDKFRIAVTGISAYETEHLRKAGVSEEILEAIRQFYGLVDERRFAGAFGTEAEMEQVLLAAKHLINRLEKGEVA